MRELLLRREGLRDDILRQPAQALLRLRNFAKTDLKRCFHTRTDTGTQSNRQRLQYPLGAGMVRATQRPCHVIYSGTGDNHA
ncbi:MAG: hypothetical protein BWY76_01094 [bacterium ADurb.Bin429]|nr:MAG: hypothetical protein BWY76_01094 [bacterium ADurb.Bin429]